MSMKIQKGNLLDAAVAGDIPMILHGCNCFHGMHSGIAGEISKRFPEVTEADNRTIKGYIGKLGTFSFANVTYEVLHEVTPGKTWTDYPAKPLLSKGSLEHKFSCINLYTQYQGGPDFIESIFPSAINHVNEVFSGETIGIPLLGCGVGGSNWEFVMGVLLEYGDDVDWRVYVL